MCRTQGLDGGLELDRGCVQMPVDGLREPANQGLEEGSALRPRALQH
jgi:hypothetical protein